jgi:hypothetical protein
MPTATVEAAARRLKASGDLELVLTAMMKSAMLAIVATAASEQGRREELYHEYNTLSAIQTRVSNYEE